MQSCISAKSSAVQSCAEQNPVHVQCMSSAKLHKVKVKVTSPYMPQRASQRKLGKKLVTKPILTKGEASIIDKRERRKLHNVQCKVA